MPAERPGRAPKILIVKPSSLGDVIHALPVLRLLKRHLPHAQIHWCIESSLAPLLEDDPDLAGLIRFERQRWSSPLHWPELFATIRQLRRLQFDWVIDLQGLARSALLGWIANGDVHIGLDNRTEGGREGARAAYDLTPPRSAADVHAVERYLSVLPLLDVPVGNDFEWLPEKPPLARFVRHEWGLGEGVWIALLPGARWESKRWPVDHYRQLVAQITIAAPDVRFLVLGGPADTPRARTIVAAAPDRALDLTGRTSLPEMVECLRCCTTVISNDSGPLHVAAALRKPVIALFGPTDPRATGPYQAAGRVLQNHSLPCVPCLQRRCRWVRPLECLESITPATVAEAALRLLT